MYKTSFLFYIAVNEFSSDTITVTFPPSTTNDEQTVSIPITNDNVLEPEEEGFYLVVTVNTASDDSDESRSRAIRNGVALINIVDDDGMYNTQNRRMLERFKPILLTGA